jgi:diaminopimelate epimerase
MTLSFTKMNGAGNDFVMLDNRDGSIALTGAQIALLCDRHRGVGADGLLVVEPPANGADFRMRYYNADGGEAEMCGNGARCFARYARRVSGRESGTISFETQAGRIGAKCLGEEVQIDMSEPHSYATATTLAVDGEELTVHSINTGVPHAVIFVKVAGPGEIAVRTYERGVEGETLACGTGVVACALIHHLESGASSPISIRVRGGDTLRVGFEHGATAGDFAKVTLAGPADFVFDGTVAL